MLINKHIGFDKEDGVGIMGDQFQQELLFLDTLDKKRIQVWINSPGGSVIDAMSIYSAILKSSTKVDTYCVGIAASAAGLIYQAGRKRYISDYGKVMIHPPSGGDPKTMNAFKDSVVTMLTSRSKMSSEDCSYLMDRTTWIGADECIKLGLADEIENSNDLNKKRQLSEPVTDAWKEANKIINKHFTTNNKMNKELALSLGLAEDATIEQIQNAVNSLKDKATRAPEKVEVPVTDATAVSAAVTNALKPLTEKIGTIETELSTVKNKNVELEKVSAKEKAVAMVKNYSTRIGSDEAIVAKWVEQATNDFEGTETLLKAIPVNIKTTKLVEVTNTLKEGEMPTSAVSLMAQIKNNLKKK